MAPRTFIRKGVRLKSPNLYARVVEAMLTNSHLPGIVKKKVASLVQKPTKSIKSITPKEVVQKNK